MSSFAGGSVISRSSVPVTRSLGIVIEVTRNIVMNGKRPSIFRESARNAEYAAK